MLLKERSHWPWTWREWEKVKYGLMGRVSEDTGQHMLVVIAVTATTLQHLGLQSVS